MTSAANVTPIFKPDSAAMLAHLEHLFGGYLDGYHDGKIELAWTVDKPDESGRYPLKFARLFGTDELEELVTEAVRINSTPMVNVYIGAGLRHPHTMPANRASDDDALCLTALYVDLDDPGAATAAKDIYAGTKPTMVVVTGREPHTRAQMWWRLDEPITDHAEWVAALRGMCAALNGDPSVVNTSRVMRLAGSIAWPQKAGRVTEHTAIAPLKTPGLPVYNVNQITSLFPPVYESKSGSVSTAAAATIQKPGALGLPQDLLNDGRETYMRDTLIAVLAEYIGTNGCEPTPQELFDAAWPQYEKKVDLSKPGRGAAEMARKCRSTLARFARGEIKSMRTLDDAIASYVARNAPKPSPLAPAPDAPKEGPILAATLTGEPKPREWIVDQWIPKGVVTALYGDGGIGKTLLAQQLLCSAALGAEWIGLDVPLTRGLGIFCEDDEDELHRRQNAIKEAMGYAIGNPFDNLWIWPRVGYDNLLVTFDKNNQPVMSPFFDEVMAHVIEKQVGLLVLDTVADLFGGNEIIRAQVNFFIKAVCGAYIKRAKENGFTLTVVILAHPSQSGRNTGSGESGSTAWNNAVRSRLYLTKDDGAGSDARTLTRKKSNYAASGDDQSLALKWENGAIVKRPQNGPSDWLPTRDVCRQILAMIDTHWRSKGTPPTPVLSSRKETRADGRYAAEHIARNFPVSFQNAERLVSEWLMNGVLTVDVYDKSAKAKGLRVTGQI